MSRETGSIHWPRDATARAMLIVRLRWWLIRAPRAPRWVGNRAMRRWK